MGGSNDPISRICPNLEGEFSQCVIAASPALPFAAANAIVPGQSSFADDFQQSETKVFMET
jgi:hypothetical protein